jgi:hypothetical protein
VRIPLALLTVACMACSSGSEAVKHVRTTPTPKPEPILIADAMPDWGRRPPSSPRRKVQVQGIEGTLASFDVKVTMEKKAREFAACHEPRARRVPMLSGSIEFGIHVKHSGDVSGVELRSSDVGDRELERCFADVIRNMQFPRPNGGDANVSYTMFLGPPHKGREPEVWTEGRVQHLVQKRLSEVRAECALERGEAFTVTAYVNARGKVIAAGVAAKTVIETERFDCIADQLARWPMPKPSKKRVAKVTFALPTNGRG